MLPVKITYHAKQRMKQRGISETDVINTLTPPTKITSGKAEKFVATKNGIRVVYAVTNKEIMVVTVTRK